MKKVILAALSSFLISQACLAYSEELSRETVRGVYSEFNNPKIEFQFDLDQPSLASAKTIRLNILSETFPLRSLKTMWLHAVLLNSEGNIVELQTESLITLFNSMNDILREGDQLVITKAGSTTLSTINGYEISMSANDQFFDVLLGALIGEVPYDAVLKKQLVSSAEQSKESVL